MKSGHRMYESASGRILLVVLTIFFTLCVGPANSAPDPGTVTIVLAGEPTNLEPGEYTRALEAQVMRNNLLETLTELNPDDSSVMPRLATSWKQIDKTTWHFSLRKGVKFHDGADFNAEAAIYSIKRLYDKRTESSTRNKYFHSVKLEGKALDSYTLEIKTDNFEPLLPVLMAVLPICSPNTPVVKSIRNPMGTGPYKFVKWDAGSQIILERFDGYWGKQPQVKKAVYVWRGESSVRAAMVLIGEADLAPELAVQDANRPEIDRSYLNAETTMLRFGGEWYPPFNDRRVRLALNYAVDRDAIRGSILSKDIVPASQLVVPGTFGYNPDLKVWPYDPKKAKQLLDEARKDGVPVDREITLVGRIAHYPGSNELLEAVMTMYKAVGLNVKLRMMEPGVQRTYMSKPYPAGVVYILQKAHNNNAGDAAFTFYNNYHCKGEASSMCDKQVDDLIEKGQDATGEQRKNLFRATFKLIQEIIPDAMLFHMVGYARVGKRINFKPSLLTTVAIPLEQITFKQ